ncbi:MAG: hypothetical protein IPM81_10515 [Saprospirales bacterium]|nr:hypothetical protein [Saprospirales bacterium]
MAPLDADIYRLEQELSLGLPAQAQLDNLKRATDLYQKNRNGSVYAPSDGLVGTVHCREGQNIQAFQTLISFYEQNPNTVVAYVHESLLLDIRMGDSCWWLPACVLRTMQDGSLAWGTGWWKSRNACAKFGD